MDHFASILLALGEKVKRSFRTESGSSSFFQKFQSSDLRYLATDLSDIPTDHWTGSPARPNELRTSKTFGARAGAESESYV